MAGTYAKRIAFLTVLASAVSLAAVVSPFNYSNDFSKYGVQPNLCPVTNPKGICAAVAAINSFAYLQNSRGDLYGTSLLPNLKNDGTDPTDAMDFGVNGWTVGMNPHRDGYYPRPGTAYDDYIATKKDWIEDHVPGKTTYEVRYAGQGGAPDVAWLATQIMKKQDVEFFVQGTGFFHAMTLVGVSCTGDDYTNCSITFQDPNEPTKTYSRPLTIGANSLGVTDLPSSGFVGALTITGAFAESPVPEPGTIGFAVVAILVGWQTRRSRMRNS